MAQATTTRGGYSTGASMASYVSSVTLLYLTMAFGTALTIFLFISFLGSPMGTSLGGFGSMGSATLAGAITAVWSILLILGPIVTTLVAFFVGRSAGTSTPAPIVGAVSNVVGVLVTLIVMFLLILLLSPTGGGMGSGLGRLLVGFLGIGIGVGVTGAAGGALGASFQDL